MPKNPSLLKIAQTANKAGYVDVKLGDYLRTKTGFKEGQKVGVSLKFLKDKNGRVMPELTLSADKNGNTVVLKRGKPTLPIEAYIAELFQDAVIYSAQLTDGKARIRRLVPNNDNFEPVIKEKNFKPQACQEEFRVLPDFLKSITEDRGASARFKMLASNDNSRRTTAAGDECYTPKFLVEAVLQALQIEKFDLDACSMHSSGRFNYARTKRTPKPNWGSTPEIFQHPKKVIGVVPAKVRFTNDLPFGSLARAWLAEYVWCNPPYTSRLWATFGEYAQHQVEIGNSKIVVLLAPLDNSGQHVAHVHSKNAFPITLSREVPFFKKEKRDKSGKKIEAENCIDTIKGNQFVIYGLRKNAVPVLKRLLDILLDMEYIEENQYWKYRDWFHLNGGNFQRRR